MRRLLIAATVLTAAAGTPRAEEGDRPVLVELFTSQGCSSCPPADRFVRDLPRLGLGPPRVVPLTFHVDYWDHLGWPDRFAMPAFSARQAWYAQVGRLRPPSGADRALMGPYTPQMVVDGRVQFPGGQTDVARAEIAAAARRPAVARVTGRAAPAGGAVKLTLDVTGVDRLSSDGAWRLVGALIQKTARTQVHRGENAGETLEEAAVVRVLAPPQPLERAGAQTRTVALQRPADLPWSEAGAVAFIQSARTGEVAAAAAIPLPDHD